jgi:hypothetical protein
MASNAAVFYYQGTVNGRYLRDVANSVQLLHQRVYSYQGAVIGCYLSDVGVLVQLLHQRVYS